MVGSKIKQLQQMVFLGETVDMHEKINGKNPWED